MPWDASSANRFNKGLSKNQRKKWANVANGALHACMDGGASEKDCAGRAIRIANSKFSEVPGFTSFIGDNPVLDVGLAEELHKKYGETYEPPEAGNAPDGVKNILSGAYSSCRKGQEGAAVDKEKCAKIAWAAVHNAGWKKNDKGIWEKHEASQPSDVHVPCTDCDEKKKMKEYAELFAIDEMEIFRPGKHHDDDIEYTEKDLEDIASNFKALVGEVKPKLKITHADDNKQKSIAGLASYGDIVDVFVKQLENGGKRLFAKIANVPQQVMDWIKERRFPERSIEIYPTFKLRTDKSAPVYRNVLKAIALLGHEMPAVTGMAPIMMTEDKEFQKTKCIGEFCCECEERQQTENENKMKLLDMKIKLTQKQFKKEDMIDVETLQRFEQRHKFLRGGETK